MESTNISLKLTDLAELCCQILSSDSCLEQLLELFTNNSDILEEQAIWQHIPADMLRRFFDHVLINNKYLDLFVSFLDLADDSSVTEDLLDYVLACNNSYLRSRCIVSLSHKDLPVDMLVTLCKTNISFECYFELLIKVYQDSVYSVKDLRRYLLMYIESPYRNMYTELTREILCHHASSIEKEQLIANHRFQEPLF